MIDITDRDQPTFIYLPINNLRTAWRPINLPAILVVPHCRTLDGTPIQWSEPLSATVTIEDVPHTVPVAAHPGLYYPAGTIDEQIVSQQELNARLIPINVQQFISAKTNTQIDYQQATSGDSFTYTSFSGITDTIVWYQDANYYDLSDIALTTEQLPPKHYTMAYMAKFYNRVVAANGVIDPITGLQGYDLLCIDINNVGLARSQFTINHPGEVIRDFCNLTPQTYFSQASKAIDPTISVYRPLTDALQDVFDEQTFLRSANWINSAPYQTIPYIAAILGWDIPYFPLSKDALRTVLIKNTVRLQQLKGSRQAIEELMAIFGYTILINSIWSSTDGNILIEPNTPVPEQYTSQTITFKEQYQIEPVLSSYQTSGFGELTIPLLCTPQELSGLDSYTATISSANITIDAYLVQTGSSVDLALNTLSLSMQVDLEQFADLPTTVDSDGFMVPWPVNKIISAPQLIGHSQILVQSGTAVAERLSGSIPPLSKIGVKFDKHKNSLIITFNGYLDLSSQSLYCFATYQKWDTIVPIQIANLQTNRFTVQVMSRDNKQVDPSVIDFLLDFIYKIKAFNSILHKVKYMQEFDEVFNVSDVCVGGDVLQRYNTAMGMQQVPPAIIPKVPGDSCGDTDPVSLGYKQSDLDYRSTVLTGLLDELMASLSGQQLTNTPTSSLYTTTIDPGYKSNQSSVSYQSNTELVFNSGVTNFDSSVRGSFNSDSIAQRPNFVPDGKTDYCYAGRVSDALLEQLTIANDESFELGNCGIVIGNGVYWTERVDCDDAIVNGSWLGRLNAEFDFSADEIINFSNRRYAERIDGQAAILRPSLNIQVTTMHLPGCRFVAMNKLFVDFTSSWPSRPWDRCQSSSHFFVAGNGLVPDVSSMGTHVLPSTIPSASCVVHSVFTSAGSGSSAVVLDQLIHGSGTVTVTTKVFGSASGSHDFADGNAALSGFVSAAVDPDRNGLYNSVFSAIGVPIPSNPIPYFKKFGDIGVDCGDLGFGIFGPFLLPQQQQQSSNTINVLFLAGSGILSGKGQRLDCNCLSIASGTGPVAVCNDLGGHDFSCDFVDLDASLSLDECVSGSSWCMDGSIPTLLEVLDPG